MICKDGVTAEWNNELWGLVNINSNNDSEISCNIDFTYEGTLVDYVKMMANYSDEIVEDDFGNLRYIGANPNNYVNYNCTDLNNENTCEKWRIIGVMKEIENVYGTKADQIKLIRNESIGLYSWDNTGSDGSNDWSDSALQKVLNRAYWDRTKGNCPSGSNGATKICDFSSIGLTPSARYLTNRTEVWNLGGSDSSSKLAREFYELERGSTVYEGRPTTWTGKVGLC